MHERPIRIGDRQPLGEPIKEVRTPEAFRQRWGDIEYLDEMWTTSKELSSDLEYHDFEHTLDVLWSTMELVDQLEKDGYTLNRRVLVGAALFHDVRYGKPSKSAKPSWRERRSAKIFKKYAPEFGFSEDETELGYTAIRDTFYSRRPRTDESKVLIRADINNIAGDYASDLVRNTQLLHKEEKHTNKDISYRKFVRNSVRILTKYLDKDLSLGENDSTYKAWHAQGVRNVYRLAESVKGKGFAPPRKLVKMLGSLAIQEA